MSDELRTRHLSSNCYEEAYCVKDHHQDKRLAAPQRHHCCAKRTRICVQHWRSSSDPEDELTLQSQLHGLEQGIEDLGPERSEKDGLSVDDGGNH